MEVVFFLVLAIIAIGTTAIIAWGAHTQREDFSMWQCSIMLLLFLVLFVLIAQVEV